MEKLMQGYEDSDRDVIGDEYDVVVVMNDGCNDGDEVHHPPRQKNIYANSILSP